MPGTAGRKRRQIAVDFKQYIQMKADNGPFSLLMSFAGLSWGLTGEGTERVIVY